ncbi:MAG: hypothetical protein JSU70_05410, partial [Phycisphaerales bacterium]
VSYRSELAVALLRQIQQECSSNDAGFVILDVPKRRSRTEFEPTFPDHEGPWRDSFHVFSPIERFAQYKGEKLYWEKSHGHFTPLGCRIVGEGLAEFILESGLFGGDISSAGAVSVRSERAQALE